MREDMNNYTDFHVEIPTPTVEVKFCSSTQRSEIQTKELGAVIWICNAWKDPENLTEQHSPLNFQYNNKALLFLKKFN